MERAGRPEAQPAQRAIRPEARPGHLTRTLVALGLSIWTLLQVLTLVVAAARGGPSSSAFAFFATGVLTLCLAAASWRAWAWTGRARPRSYTFGDDDPATRHHRGLTGEHEPPTRW